MSLIIQFLLYACAIVMQALGITFLLIILLQQKIAINKKCFWITAVVFTTTLLSLYAKETSTNSRAFFTIFFICVHIIAARIIFKEPISKCLIAALFTFVLGAAAEVFTIFIATGGFKYSFIALNTNITTKIICTFFINISFFIIGYIINLFIIRHMTEESIIKNNNSFLNILFLVAVLILPQVFYLINTQYKVNFLFMFTSFIQLSIILLISFQKMKIITMQLKIERDLENEKMHNQTLNSIIETVRGFKHDNNNILNTLNGYIELNDMEGLRSYFKKGLLKSSYNLKTLEQLSPSLLNDSGIYNLIASKYFECANNNILLNLEICCDIASIDINKYDLSIILGILIDNAIEATTKLKKIDKTISFRMLKNYSNGTVKIIIENEFIKSDSITVENVFKKNFSTKKVPSGFGLYEVRKKLSVFDNAQIETDIIDNKFKQTLIIEPIKVSC